MASQTLGLNYSHMLYVLPYIHFSYPINTRATVSLGVYPLFCVPGLSNVEFYCGKAEDVFPTVLNAVVSPNVTAIVDPPRAGMRTLSVYSLLSLAVFKLLFFLDTGTLIKLHVLFFFFFFFKDSKVILAIRRAEHLKRLVYVACNAKAAMNNFVE